MPIEVRTITGTAQGINSFDLQQSTAAVSNENVTETFTSFLNSSSRYIEQIAQNFSMLIDGVNENALAYVEDAQGTSWLPYTMGGTYYPKGWYVWSEGEWNSSKSNVAETLDALGSGTGGAGSFSGDYNDLTNQPVLPTQITDAQIAALGYIKTDNDTQLSDIQIGNFGYVKTDNNTQLTDSEIGAFGYVKTDNDTQLSDAQIAAFGYIKTDNDTQLSDGDIAAFGYVKTDNNTQLSDADITALGYVKTDNDTQLSDADITALGYIKSAPSRSYFQVQDDGVTTQTTGNGYVNVQGLWATPTLTSTDFTWDATTGQLTTNKAGVLEISAKVTAKQITGNNRNQLDIILQKNLVTLTGDKNYASRNNNQHTGGAYITNFRVSCAVNDVFRLRVKDQGVAVVIGHPEILGYTYLSVALNS